MQHEGNSMRHRLAKLSLRCLFPSSFLSRFFPAIFPPYDSGLYFSTTSYLLYLPYLFSILFLSRFHFLNYHYLTLLFLFCFLCLSLLLLLLLFHFSPFTFYFSLPSLLHLLSTLRFFILHFISLISCLHFLLSLLLSFSFCIEFYLHSFSYILFL